MYDWNALQKNLLVLQNDPVVWHPDISAHFQREWNQHSSMVFEQLLHLVSLQEPSDAEKERHLREYLALRWQLIQRTSVDYTFHLQLPVNRACLLVAEAIVKPDEAVMQILMPTVTAVIGIADPTLSLKEASEDVNGKFLPACFLINATADAVIALPDFFEYAKEDTDRVFSDNPLFQLTHEDQKNICAVSPEVEHYFGELAAIHRAKNNEKMSVGYSLRYLQKALLKASRSRLGNETQADFAQCETPILRVYEYWRKLEKEYPDIHRKLAGYQDANHLDVLENYLLALFSSLSNIGLTDHEVSVAVMLKRNISFCCAEQMANALLGIITNNPDLETIPLPGHEAEFDAVVVLPTATALKTSSDAMRASLNRRVSMIGCDGEALRRLPIFEAIALERCSVALDFCDEYFLMLRLCREQTMINTRVNNLENIPELLWMLPKNQWLNFFSSFARKITGRLSQIEYPVELLSTWIQKIPPKHWSLFFEAILSVTALHRVFRVETISYFFENCPEGHWAALYTAMMPLSLTLFKTPLDLGLFFKTLESSLHFTAIAALFLSDIKKVFDEHDKPECILAALFMNQEKTQWFLLAEVLDPIFSEKIIRLSQVNFMLGRIEKRSDRLQFLKQIMRHVKALSVPHDVLFAFLQLFHKEEWGVVMQCVMGKRLSSCVFDHQRLEAFLTLFSNVDDRIGFTRALQIAVFVYEPIDVRQICRLLKKFPECDAAFLKMYRQQLVRIFNDFLVAFKVQSQYETPISIEMRKDFCLLVEKALPVILEYAYFFSPFIDGNLAGLTEEQRQFMSAIQHIESEPHSLIICCKKIELFDIFCRENPTHVHFHQGVTPEFFKNVLQQWKLFHALARDQATQVERQTALLAASVAPLAQRVSVFSNTVSRASTPGITRSINSPRRTLNTHTPAPVSISLRDSEAAIRTSQAFFRTDREVTRGLQQTDRQLALIRTASIRPASVTENAGANVNAAQRRFSQNHPRL